MTTTAAQMVLDARTQIENLSVARVVEELNSGTALLLDIREPDERERDGQIPEAVPAPRGMLEFWADPTNPSHRADLDPRRRIILYCASGGRSALAARTLQDLGFEDVAHLDGGLKAWVSSGRAVARPAPW